MILLVTRPFFLDFVRTKTFFFYIKVESSSHSKQLLRIVTSKSHLCVVHINKLDNNCCTENIARIKWKPSKKTNHFYSMVTKMPYCDGVYIKNNTIITVQAEAAKQGNTQSIFIIVCAKLRR